MVEGSSSHRKFGHHGSAEGILMVILIIKGIPPNIALQRSQAVKDSEEPKTDLKFWLSHTCITNALFTGFLLSPFFKLVWVNDFRGKEIRIQEIKIR
ncbi:hypothetical protein AAG906_000556 [Vitis piasezkii]